MTDDERVRAEARFAKVQRAEQQAEAGAAGRAAYDAEIAARDANMARLRALRLARDENERTAQS